MVEYRKQFLYREISRVVPVERDELPALVWSFTYFFSLLAAYYILRPVRDEMGMLSGTHTLPWLFSAVFMAMLAVIPLFGWVPRHLTIRRLLPFLYVFFVFHLLGFFIALQSGSGLAGIASVFFVWLSVFNLFVVSLFWSFMADMFSTEAARRLFGCIDAGGSLGVIAGPLLTTVTVRGVGVPGLLLVAATLLLGEVGCILALLNGMRIIMGLI